MSETKHDKALDEHLTAFERGGKGKPAPTTLYLVMGEDGVERTVSHEQPERGHVLVQAGEAVEPHVLQIISQHRRHVEEQAAKAKEAAKDEKKTERPGAGKSKDVTEQVTGKAS